MPACCSRPTPVSDKPRNDGIISLNDNENYTIQSLIIKVIFKKGWYFYGKIKEKS